MGGPLKSFLAALLILFTLSTAHAAGPTQPPPFVPASPTATIRVQSYRFAATVDQKSAQAVGEFLEQARKNHVDVVMIEMVTPGGSYAAGHEIARYIENSPVPVVCVADGLVASMGVYIFQSCDRRLITSRGMLMLHSALASTPDNMENEHDLQQKINMVRCINRAYGSQVIRHMHITLDEYLAKIADGKEWWLSAEEAVKVGAAAAVFSGTPNDLLKAIRSGQTP